MWIATLARKRHRQPRIRLVEATGEGDTSNFDDYEAYNPTTYQNKLSASDVAIIKKEGGFGDW